MEELKNIQDSKSIDLDELAELRTTFARTRTYQAAERTYTAWIRTGFTIATAGVTLGTALRGTERKILALFIGGTLIVLGMSTFLYAWIGYLNTYRYIKKYYTSYNVSTQAFKYNIIGVTLFSVVLLIVSVLGFWLMLGI